MVKTSGDTQARFFRKEPGFFVEQSAGSIQPKKRFTAEGREGSLKFAADLRR